jgi:periplasmic copper chaperone A
MYRFTLPGNRQHTSTARRAAAGTLCVLIAVTASACSSSAKTAAASTSSANSSAAVASGPRGSASIGHIKITGAYIPQPATPSVAAAYFTVTETGSQGDVLLSATSVPASQASLMQETASGANAGTMTDITGGLAIPADGAVVLGPGGYHLMLTNPASPLTSGGSVALTLRFKDAGTVTLKVPVTSLLSDALTSSTSTSTATSTSGSGMANMPGM